MSAAAVPVLPVTSESVSPEAFIQREKDPSLISSVRITPPRLGESGFGSITIGYRRPIYRYRFGGAGRRG
jgi:hypothetical protein